MSASFPAQKGNTFYMCIVVFVCFFWLCACGTATSTGSATPTAMPTSSTPQYTPTVTGADAYYSNAARIAFYNLAEGVQYKDYATLYSTTSSDYQTRHTQQDMIQEIQLLYKDGNNDSISSFTSCAAIPTSHINPGTTSPQMFYGDIVYKFSNGHSIETYALLILENQALKVAAFD